MKTVNRWLYNLLYSATLVLILYILFIYLFRGPIETINIGNSILEIYLIMLLLSSFLEKTTKLVLNKRVLGISIFGLSILHVAFVVVYMYYFNIETDLNPKDLSMPLNENRLYLNIFSFGVIAIMYLLSFQKIANKMGIDMRKSHAILINFLVISMVYEAKFMVILVISYAINLVMKYMNRGKS